jgi:hypothetical protein
MIMVLVGRCWIAGTVYFVPDSTTIPLETKVRCVSFFFLWGGMIRK